MALSGSFCGLVRRKAVSFVVLLVQLGLVGWLLLVQYSVRLGGTRIRVSKVRVGIRVIVRISVSLVLLIGLDMNSRR